ncbi:MAG TPA: RRXRR domain-containing protein [Ktedonobacteraceae bacterium]|nr:RRXRR domain-containing protein [Ktedonobacteraceae bacterium]
MSYVFVVDQQRKPLDPVHSGRARFLLKAGHAAVLRRYPFVIILKGEKQECEPEPLLIKIDPGSKTTGLAVVNDQTGKVVWAAELTHRKETIQGIHVRYCHPLHRADGYSYQKGTCVSSPDLKVGVSTHEV